VETDLTVPHDEEFENLINDLHRVAATSKIKGFLKCLTLVSIRDQSLIYSCHKFATAICALIRSGRSLGIGGRTRQAELENGIVSLLSGPAPLAKLKAEYD
jgi:hypothetical protein